MTWTFVETENLTMIQAKQINLVSPESLTPHPKNMNKHSDAQIERLVKLIEYQGFRNPIIVQKGTGLVVAGHGRLMAAQKLGLKEVPVTEQEFESEAQLYAYMVSDNAIAEMAVLDLSMVNAEVGNLGPDFDLQLLGIENFELDPPVFTADLPKDSESKPKTCPACGEIL